MDIDSYLLGVFDGEGSVTTGRGGEGGWFVGVGVTMASEPICRLFQERFGGGVTRQKRLTVGGLQLWTWQLGGSKTIPILELLETQSLVKREQAILGLRMARSMARYRWARLGGEFDPTRGNRFLSPDDLAEREEIVACIRALNGARSRYGRANVTAAGNKCKRCGYEWLPRSTYAPLRCPKCLRRDWNENELLVEERRIAVQECLLCGHRWPQRGNRISKRCQSCKDTGWQTGERTRIGRSEWTRRTRTGTGGYNPHKLRVLSRPDLSHPGERHPNAKLTDDQVRAMREEYAAGEKNYNDIAVDYGVSAVTVGLIIRRQTWQHI